MSKKQKSRTLLVYGEQVFKVSVPADAKITFGPFSPPKKGEFQREGLAGTLRIYQGSKDNIIACFTHVTSFRDVTLEYAEQVAKEEGATIWKSDQNGYQREEKISRKKQWVKNQKLLEEGNW